MSSALAYPLAHNNLKPLRFFLPLAFIVVVLIIISTLLRTTATKTLQVMTVTPITKTTINLNQQFVITFNRPPTQSEQLQLEIKFTPTFPSSFTWQGSTLYIYPQKYSYLTESSPYKLEIVYQDHQVGTYNYNTISAADLSETDQLNYQQFLDLQYNDQVNRTFIEKPWLEELPLDTDDYVVTYDYQADQVRIRIKHPPSSNSLKQNIINTLQSKKIPTDNILWL
jgi:hypothetical protein